MSTDPQRFSEPDWSAPLDVEACIDAVPADATMSGMFLAAVVSAASSAGHRLPSARASYTAFRKYPMREHCVIMVEAARAIWPAHSMREGLRRLGRGAPRALMTSMLGRVVLGSVEGPAEIVRAMARAYPLNSSPGSLEVGDAGPGRVVVRLRDIHHFLDSHHVGVFEGVLRHAGVEGGHVRLASLSRSDADLSCEWRA